MKSSPAVIAAAILTLASCTGRYTSGKPVLAASVAPVAAMVEAIAGPGYEVVCVTEGGADPESFEPSPSVMGKMARAEAFFTTGTLPFERPLAAALPSGAYEVNLSRELNLISGTHEDTAMTDPHIWASLTNLARMSATVEAWLADARPDSAAVYGARGEAWRRRCAAAFAAADSALGAAGRPAFGVWHPSLSYFARDFGLRQVSIGAEHRELSPRRMRAAIDSLRAARVAVLFYDHPGQSGPQAIAAEAGAGAVLLEAAPADYVDYIVETANTVANGRVR